jgi:hypothetical protein
MNASRGTSGTREGSSHIRGARPVPHPIPEVEHLGRAPAGGHDRKWGLGEVQTRTNSVYASVGVDEGTEGLGDGGGGDTDEAESPRSELDMKAWARRWIAMAYGWLMTEGSFFSSLYSTDAGKMRHWEESCVCKAGWESGHLGRSPLRICSKHGLCPSFHNIQNL